MLFVDNFDKICLVQVHQLREASWLGGNGPWLSREKTNLSENVTNCQVFNVGFTLLLKDYDASLYDEEKALSLLLFNLFVIINILSIDKLLIIVNPILLISLFKNKVIHQENLLLKHENNFRL